MAVTTLPERKRLEAARRGRAARSVMEELRTYARAKGGCFVVFGSVASGRVRYDSDIDILVDFPAEESAQAWCFAEEICARHAIALDILDAATTRAAFVEVIRDRGVALR